VVYHLIDYTEEKEIQCSTGGGKLSKALFSFCALLCYAYKVEP